MEGLSKDMDNKDRLQDESSKLNLKTEYDTNNSQNSEPIKINVNERNLLDDYKF